MWSTLVSSALRSTRPALVHRCLSTTMVARESFQVQDVEDFKKRVLESKIPVLVDFHAEWCGPCKMLMPRLERVVRPLNEKLHLAKVNIDNLTDLAIEYNVTAVPAVVAIKNGQIVDRFMGLQDEDKIKTFVQRFLE